MDWYDHSYPGSDSPKRPKDEPCVEVMYRFYGRGVILTSFSHSAHVRVRVRVKYANVCVAVFHFCL